MDIDYYDDIIPCNNLNNKDSCIGGHLCGWCEDTCVDVHCGSNVSDYSQGLTSTCDKELIISDTAINIYCSGNAGMVIFLIGMLGLLCSGIGSYLFLSVCANPTNPHKPWRFIISGIIAIAGAIVCGASINNAPLQIPAIAIVFSILGVGIISSIIRCVCCKWRSREYDLGEVHRL